jgi:hypothetical protein
MIERDRTDSAQNPARGLDSGDQRTITTEILARGIGLIARHEQ